MYTTKKSGSAFVCEIEFCVIYRLILIGFTAALMQPLANLCNLC